MEQGGASPTFAALAPLCCAWTPSKMPVVKLRTKGQG